jgi:hypothetical protein
MAGIKKMKYAYYNCHYKKTPPHTAEKWRENESMGLSND